MLVWDGWQKVLIGLVFSTFLGFGMGLLLTVAIYWTFRTWRPGQVRVLFGRLQIASAAFMAFSHGSNDGQKFIWTFVLTLVLSGVLPQFDVALCAILLCAGTMGVGTAVGGWRIVKTMGLRITKLDPVHGFAAKTAAASAIELASGSASPSARPTRSTRRSWAWEAPAGCRPSAGGAAARS